MVDKDCYFDKIESILNGSSNFYISSTEQLNKCLDQVVQLISDAYVLYINNHIPPHLFQLLVCWKRLEKFKWEYLLKVQIPI